MAMSLLDNPIPPKPALFVPEGAPPGVVIDFKAFHDGAGNPWWPTRLEIRPRLQLVHTNSASREGSLQSQIDWGNSSPYGRTHPHYALNAPRPTKLVPTNRRGIGNFTVESARGTHGNVTDWSIVIETADIGTNVNPAIGPFLYDHAEIVARILAYESMTWGIPLSYPAEWWSAGSACHTEPFGYPYWTKENGKTCPGTEKKRQMREEVLPRARQIVQAWSAPVVVEPPVVEPPVKDTEMDPYLVRPKGFLNVFLVDGADAIHLAPEMLVHVQNKLGELPVIEINHQHALDSILHKAGLSRSALVAG